MQNLSREFLTFLSFSSLPFFVNRNAGVAVQNLQKCVSVLTCYILNDICSETFIRGVFISAVEINWNLIQYPLE